ncbi:hypothetical protein ASPCAL00227 [Aspergillus calidoustus]|uniref:Gag1-like clamp domain-containing protein n=1 Tax=Aspergillus calidoustus TaxID=454130 RepID=A0A0U4YUN0_ASPCI|nr:hypothetical protein ASPCAL00227 [Aspergillus calidoustus]
MTADSRDDAIREAKRYVRDVVRNDWSFEFSAKPGAPPPTYPANPEPTDVLEWRLREYDSSGSELEPQFSPIGSPGLYDGDASLAGLSISSADSRRTERRRKRRRQMEEEMTWNEGLRTWVERRDAWSGARSREKVREWELRSRGSVEAVGGGGGGGGELAGASAGIAAGDATDTDAQSIPASATLRPIAVPATGEESNLVERTETALNIAGKDENNAAAPSQQLQPASPGDLAIPPNAILPRASPVDTDPIDLPQPPSASSAIPATSPPSTSSATTSSIPSAPTDAFDDPLIPVVPSLISTSNPIRASITPSMYPSIYSKVVLQGLTPTVPINLADMTKAMVQGWKADGQWPPKPQNIVLPNANDAIARPNHASATKHPDTPAIPLTSSTAAGADRERNPPTSPESKRRSGIASTVRKVLHFSGFHPHPFHRRNSSSQHHSHPEDLSPAGEGAGTGAAGEQADK